MMTYKFWLWSNLYLNIKIIDIQKLMKNDEKKLTNEDLEAQQHLNEKKIEETKNKFSLQGWAGVFSKVNVALLKLEAID